MSMGSDRVNLANEVERALTPWKDANKKFEVALEERDTELKRRGGMIGELREESVQYKEANGKLSMALQGRDAKLKELYEDIRQMRAALKQPETVEEPTKMLTLEGPAEVEGQESQAEIASPTEMPTMDAGVEGSNEEN